MHRFFAFVELGPRVVAALVFLSWGSASLISPGECCPTTCYDISVDAVLSDYADLRERG